MKLITLRRTLYGFLIICITISPFLLSSCDDDDDGAEPSETTDEDDNNNDPSDDPSGSEYNLTVSGDMTDELSNGFAFFSDDEEDFARDNEDFNPETDAGLLISITEMENDSMKAGVSVYMIEKNTSEIGEGSYALTSYMEFDQNAEPTIAGLSYPNEGLSFISSGAEGVLEITSRNEEVIEGSFNDVSLFNMLTFETVKLNGTFKAVPGT